MKGTQDKYKKNSEFETKTLIKQFRLAIPSVIPKHEETNSQIIPHSGFSILRSKNPVKLSKNPVFIKLPVKTGKSSLNNTEIPVKTGQNTINNSVKKKEQTHLIGSETALTKPRSDKTCLDYLEKETTTGSPKLNEDVNIVQDTVDITVKNNGQYVTKNLASVQNKVSTSKPNKLLVTLPDTNKQITIIVPQEFYETLTDSSAQNKKVVTKSEKLPSVYSILKPTEQLQDIQQQTVDVQHDQNNPALIVQKTLPHTADINLQKPLPHIIKSPHTKCVHKLISQSGAERSILKKNTVLNSTITKPIEAQQEKKSIEDGEPSQFDKSLDCGFPPSDVQILCLETCPNESDLSNQVNLEDSSQYEKCNVDVFESEVGINQPLNQLSCALDKHSTVEGENNFNDFRDVSCNNTVNCISNAQEMWSRNKSNLAEDLTKNVLLCALEDMKCYHVEDDDGNIPLQKAVLNNDKNTLKRQCIILKIMDLKYLNHQNKNLDTALLLAVKSNHEDFVATLLNYGAKQDIADKEGNTALHIAVSLQLVVCCKLLLAEEGAQNVINAFNDEGFAPIHLASIRGFDGIVRVLVSEGADINKKDAKSGRTAYHHAIVLKQQEVVKVLEGLGCNTGEPDFAGHLPLFAEVSTVDIQNKKQKEIVITSVKRKSKSVVQTNISEQTSGFDSSYMITSPVTETVKPKLNSNQTKSPVKHNKKSPVNARSETEVSVLPRKRRRRKPNALCEMYLLSSEDSDDDCQILKTKNRNDTSIIPAKKRRRIMSNILCISDDENSDCAVVDTELETNSYTVGNPNDGYDGSIMMVDSVSEVCPSVIPSSNALPEFDESLSSSHSVARTVQFPRGWHTSNTFGGFITADVDQAEERLAFMENVMKKIIINSKIF